MSSKLLIWGWYSDYDISSFLNLKKYGYSVHNRSMNKVIRFFSKIPIVGRYFLQIHFKKFLKTLGKGYKVIFSDDVLYYPSFIELLEKNNIPSGNLIVLLRNKISKSTHCNIEILKLVTDKIYTFDKYDAEEFGVRFIEQFLPVVFNNFSSDSTKHNRAYFLGLDKGRCSLLQSLKKLLNTHGIVCDFIIVKSGFIYKLKRFLGYKVGLTYEENISRLMRSDFVIEVCAHNATGLTLRALEAVHYKKKLVTNNHDIKSYEFYNPNNIIIIDDDLIVDPEFFNSNFDERSTLSDKFYSHTVYLKILS
ncbi:hypothetical protein EEJ34_09380 [Vibrio cholerae]|uniref:hypothetical protein n=1 Tax=Vibrio cholerae TaxID=666 RepID=UPI000F408AE8|nr:hypothetical protein [Vibrio cholerae]MCQ0983654.1 hypothetical protein [Vibrio cholerae]RNE65804.1 hypothetical protein EEJ34_09380 [Vibrio cholerae]